ncbi:hypothetical protein SAMN05421666_1858 [Roseovarius nanhaiticus]|uniref:Uncharacterized protein n=1 Tax=Roseovarius nanhaiticus TaxID=573024 RepID=A0A1N7GB71_9RHOB|nr:hypothetical protein [Roseovarius nanhaiticus]SEK32130.1 hypothetical protein SAMN05216208_0278 [Roseovarius nanhaiticus]SIS09784.1 hypothetical protein SAMN05421666_1858 [Roseovarius nanhaiticus]
MAEGRGRVSALILLLIAALSFGAAIFHDKNPLAEEAGAYAESIAKVSAATYVTLRTLNALLSTAQEVEVGASVGVSGNFQPGKILEPIDDTIERIAATVFSIMLVSGLLAVAMGPVGAVGGAMIAAACLLLLIGRQNHLRSGARKLGFMGAVLTLGLPICLIASDWLAGPLTGSVLIRHQAVIDDIVAEVPGADPAPLESAPEQTGILGGVLDRFSTGLDYVASGQQVLAQAGSIVTNADKIIGSYLSILAVLLFRTFLLPALLLVAGWLIVKGYIRD